MVKAAAKTDGIMPPPMKPWMRAIDDHLVDIGRRRAQSALAAVKPAAETREQHAGRDDPRERARKRDHDDFGDQIGRSGPSAISSALGGQARLDFGQRGRDDLDVEDRHEHAEDHREEGDQDFARRDPWRSPAWLQARVPPAWPERAPDRRLLRPLRPRPFTGVQAVQIRRLLALARLASRRRCRCGVSISTTTTEAGAQAAAVERVLREARCAPARAG